jgi:hypothetical protein
VWVETGRLGLKQILIVYVAGWIASLAGLMSVEGWRLTAAAGVPAWADRAGFLFTAWLAAPLLILAGPWLAWRSRRALAQG